MDEIKWFDEINKVDSKHPSEDVSDEVRYTLHQKDFLTMPDVKFDELAEIDPDIRVLLN